MGLGNIVRTQVKLYYAITYSNDELELLRVGYELRVGFRTSLHWYDLINDSRVLKPVPSERERERERERDREMP